MKALLLLAALASAPLAAQDKPARTVYQIDFVIRDTATAAPQKVTMLVIDQGGAGTVRTGTRVPVQLDAIDAKGGGAGRRTDYFDIGLNIDCRAHTLEGRVQLNADIEMSSLRKPEPGVPGSVATPAVSSVRTHVNTGVKPGQPTLIARIDDPALKRTLEVEATATPAN